MNYWLYNFLLAKIKESKDSTTAYRFVEYAKNHFDEVEYLNLQYQMYCNFN